MKLVNVVVVICLVSAAFVSGGCKTLARKPCGSRIAFQTDDCGEFIYEKCDVMDFLDSQRAKHPKAQELYDRLKDCGKNCSVKLSCDEYCPVLFNGMLARESAVMVRCEKCGCTIDQDEIKGLIANADEGQISYICKHKHTLINIRLKK